MSDITYDIGEMLDSLKMTTAAIRWKQLLNDPELGNFTAQQLLREVLTPQYVEAMNNQYTTNLKFSRLMEKNARIENLKTGNGRKYNDETVQQILTFNFMPVLPVFFSHSIHILRATGVSGRSFLQPYMNP